MELLGDVPAAAVETGRVHALATVRARDLAATPSNIKNPGWLAEQARLASEDAGLTVRIWDEHDLAADVATLERADRQAVGKQGRERVDGARRVLAASAELAGGLRSRRRVGRRQPFDERT